MSEAATRRLVVDGVSKSFGGVHAVKDLSFAIEPGEVLGLIGANGAGKSTVLKMISGFHRPDAGTISLGEERLDQMRPYKIPLTGVAMAHQVPRPFNRLSLRENVLVAAHRGRSSRAERHRAGARVEEILEITGLADRADRPAGSLGLLDRKRLELGRAIGLDPEVLLLDEIAAGLIPDEVDELLEMLKPIRAGRSLLVVEHVQTVIQRIAERVVVLDWGEKIFEGEPREAARSERVIEAYLGGEAASVRDRRPGAAVGETLLEASGVSADYGGLKALHDVDLKVGEGEIVAVLGANGAGKTTLAETISGVHVAAAGRIEFGGEEVTATPAHHRVEAGIAHCQEGRRVFAELSVHENLLLGGYSKRARAERPRMLERVHSLFPILADRADQPAALLSGGQQQMLAIGRALMSNPRLVVFDEISIGLAPEAVDRVYEALGPINELGVAIVLIEQNVQRSLALADRAYVLSRGTVTFEGVASDLAAADDVLSEAYFGAEGER